MQPLNGAMPTKRKAKTAGQIRTYAAGASFRAPEQHPVPCPVSCASWIGGHGTSP